MGQEILFDTKVFESSVGSLIKSETSPEDNLDRYLTYPFGSSNVAEIIKNIQSQLVNNKKITFVTKSIIQEYQQEDFLLSPKLGIETNPYNGLSMTLFGHLLTSQIANQILLGSFGLSYIEAKVSQIVRKVMHGDQQSIDHFYLTEGVSNISALEEVIRAHEFKKNELVVLLLPENAIKAFRQTRFSSWQLVDFETKPASIGRSKAFLFDKHHQKIGDIQLVESKATNLNFPIYKLKLQERSLLVLPYSTTYSDLSQKLNFHITNSMLDSLKSNNKYNSSQDITHNEYQEELSVGTAARVLFGLLGGDYEAVPEIMLNLEGGSHTAIATEKSSTGRHSGINSMYEVIRNEWYKHPDVVIPWNYIAFDKVNNDNLNLIENDQAYLLSLDDSETQSPNDKLYFLEAAQTWKKFSLDLIQYVSKFVYKELFNIASKKFLLSAKELLTMTSKHLAARVLEDFGYVYDESNSFDEEMKDLLDMAYYVHLLAASSGDFYSAKTGSGSRQRLEILANLDMKISRFVPVAHANFRQRIKEILSKDVNSEGFLVYNFYISVLNSIKTS